MTTAGTAITDDARARAFWAAFGEFQAALPVELRAEADRVRELVTAGATAGAEMSACWHALKDFRWVLVADRKDQVCDRRTAFHGLTVAQAVELVARGLFRRLCEAQDEK